MYQIGLEPSYANYSLFVDGSGLESQKGSKEAQNTLYDCYYRVLNLTDESKADLEYLQQLRETLKRMPTKKRCSTVYCEAIDSNLRVMDKCIIPIKVSFTGLRAGGIICGRMQTALQKRNAKRNMYDTLVLEFANCYCSGA